MRSIYLAELFVKTDMNPCPERPLTQSPACVQVSPVLPNPYGDPDCAEPLMPVQPQVDEILFSRAR